MRGIETAFVAGNVRGEKCRRSAIVVNGFAVVNQKVYYACVKKHSPRNLFKLLYCHRALP